jgi:hypothetical protein
LSGRVPDAGSSIRGTWSVESGTFALDASSSATANNTARATIDAGVSDVEVRTTLDLRTGGTGLVLRSSDRSNYLRLIVLSTGWQIHKTVAGVMTTVAKGSLSIPLKVKHTLGATLSGPVIVVTIDGTVVASVSESFNQGGTRFGLVCSGTGFRAWESFVVRKR